MFLNVKGGVCMVKGKMVICTILLVCTLCFFGGCKPQNPTVVPPAENPYFEFQGVRAGSEFSKGEAVFGTYENRIPAGDQITYMYPHFMVITGMVQNEEVITSIILRSNAVTTEEEVAIGDTRETVIAAYGAEFIEDPLHGNLIYTKKDTVLTFLIDAEGYVLTITYSQIAEE